MHAENVMTFSLSYRIQIKFEFLEEYMRQWIFINGLRSALLTVRLRPLPKPVPTCKLARNSKLNELSIKLFTFHTGTCHYSDVVMGALMCRSSSLTTVYSTIYSSADQRKYQSSASLTFVMGIHRSPVNSPHKWPVSRKMFPLDDVIMAAENDC